MAIFLGVFILWLSATNKLSDWLNLLSKMPEKDNEGA